MILIEKHWFYSNFPPGCCAHNGLVPGSSPGRPTSNINELSISTFFTPSEIPTLSPAIQSKINKFSQWHLRQAGRARRPARRSCRQRKVSTHDVCFRSTIGYSLSTSAVSEMCHELKSCSGWKSIRNTTIERLDRRAVQAEARACCIAMET